MQKFSKYLIFSVWHALCCKITYDLWQIQHSYGRSFEWTLICSRRVHFSRNLRPQSLHAYRNFSEFNVDSSALFSVAEIFSVFSPDTLSSLLNLSFPCTWRKCWFTFDELLKCLPHFEHGYGRYKTKNKSICHAPLFMPLWSYKMSCPTSPVWLRTWFAKL